jgi:WD40 repeat protein
VIAGRLALTVAAIAAAGIIVPGANAAQLHTVILSHQLAADNSVTLLTGQQGSGLLLASSSGANEVAFSPDGKLLASAYGNGTVRIWNPATDKLYGPVLQADSGQGSVNGVAFSPDGKLLASADADGTVRIWNPATGQPAGSPFQAGSSVNGVAFSPDGKLLASADADGFVRIWNPAAGQPGPGSGDWFIMVASVIAIVLSVLAVAITTREIWPAFRRHASAGGQ